MILVGLRLACWLYFYSKTCFAFAHVWGMFQRKHSEVGFAAVFFKGMLSFGYFPRPTPLGVQLPGICEGSDHLHFGANKKPSKKEGNKNFTLKIFGSFGEPRWVWYNPEPRSKKKASYFPLSHILVVE